MYSGRARWEHIADLKSAVTIPVLGNGDIFEAPDALLMMRETGCDGVVIGRGCLGNPWLFRNLARLFEGAEAPERPDVHELVRVIREHFGLMCEHYGARPGTAALQMRKFGTWYARGLKSAATLRTAFQKIGTKADFDAVIERIIETGYQQGLRDPNVPTR
jgi:tRNA-dihydrouridine synthase